MSADGELDLTAAALRADGGDVTTAIEVLARKFEDALPERTTVERRARRFMSGDKRVRSLQVGAGQFAYALRLEGGRVEAWREKTVGGIAIRRDQLELDAWLAGLTDALRDEAAHSDAARAALERLLG